MKCYGYSSENSSSLKFDFLAFCPFQPTIRTVPPAIREEEDSEEEFKEGEEEEDTDEPVKRGRGRRE